jgi:hypothetical protein
VKGILTTAEFRVFSAKLRKSVLDARDVGRDRQDAAEGEIGGEPLGHGGYIAAPFRSVHTPILFFFVELLISISTISQILHRLLSLNAIFQHPCLANTIPCAKYGKARGFEMMIGGLS